jgi:hypothetical protein
MNINYDSILIAGWRIDAPESEVNMDEYVESVALALKLDYERVGNAYSGQFCFYVTLHHEALTLLRIADIGELVRKAETKMVSMPVAFHPFQISAEIDVW